MRLGTESAQPWPSISTGAASLDAALGIGGLPIGRIVEIYGPLGVAKSTLSLSTVANAQKQGVNCLYIDAEHSLDPAYMQALGVNLEDLLLAQPSYGEEALEIVDRMVGTGAVGIVVVDSVAALTPRAEIEGSMEDNQMGLQARMMGKGLRKIIAKAAENRTLIIFVNQLRSKMSPYGNPETTPGGMALGYLSSVRIDLRRVEDIKDQSGDSIGIKVKAKIVKNKLAPPLRFAEFNVLYGKGIDSHGNVVEQAINLGVLTVGTTGWVKWGSSDEVVGRSRTAVAEMLQADAGFAGLLQKAMNGNGVHVDKEQM